ncbi:MAG: hypothetical protein ABMB14_35065, partial [Myxococcota bacterium]
SARPLGMAPLPSVRAGVDVGKGVLAWTVSGQAGVLIAPALPLLAGPSYRGIAPVFSVRTGPSVRL